MDASRADFWAAFSVLVGYFFGCAGVPVWATLSVVLGCFLGNRLFFSKKKKLLTRWGNSLKIQLSASLKLNLAVNQVNDSLYELHKPEGSPNMQVLFFHGLQFAEFSDAHVCTWKSGDGSLVWPRKWLVEVFPHAHIFTVSYNVRNLDMFLVGENLTADLISGKIGTKPYCPVILVGHCLGGLVIKNICVDLCAQLSSRDISDDKRLELETFLNNLAGIFYYGTPHHGSSHIDKVDDGPLFNYFKLLNKDAARLNSKFDHLRRSYPKWEVHGLGESLPTKSGVFEGVVVASEAAAREGDEFHVVEADHNSICQPRSTKDRRYYSLKNLLHKVTAKTELENQEEAKSREERLVQEACPPNFQHLPKQMISIDAQVKEIMGLLRNARIVRLVGMGGLGKTTIAMAMFNDLGSSFEYTCFVRDVKLITGGEETVKDAVWEHTYYHGKKLEGERNWSDLKGKNFLLVLDDISYREERVLLDLADGPAAESRFIVTSRDQQLLGSSGEVYVVPFWNNNTAKVLFKKHAFPNREKPPKKFKFLMQSIIKKCEGLPLSLEVLGKCLHKKRNDKYWEQTLSALEKAEDVKTLNEKLWANLRVSYDALGATEKQMFLDAATFFATESWTLGEAQAAWRVVYETTCERVLWQTLADMSLVYSVEDDDFIKVHEQLRQLGQRIALEPSNYDKYRIWNGEEGLKMLQTTSDWDGKRIHALRLGQVGEVQKCIHIPRAALRNLEHVRLLEVNGPMIIDGATKAALVPTKVVLLKCYGQDLFNPALQPRLAVLELSCLKDVPHSIGNLRVLKCLRIDDCDVQTLPNSFGKLDALERLTLGRLRKLESLPESFGDLSALNYLEFFRCNELQTLPESFGKLSDLNHLSFRGCNKLQTLPESFGELFDLKHLLFYYCDMLQTLPESFGQLSSLKHLSIYGCNKLQTLPESFGQLSALTRLSFKDYRELQSLPASFGKLSTLTYLEFDGCNSLQTLPESFGQLSALKHLEFFRCNELQTLPESFGQLSALHHLSLSVCNKLQTLPESFGHLYNLNRLLFYYCDKLQTLPESFGQLYSLRHLSIYDCNQLQTLPESFGKLSALKRLSFKDCSKLQTLPESFGLLSGLVRLTIDWCQSLQNFPESLRKLVA